MDTVILFYFILLALKGSFDCTFNLVYRIVKSRAKSQSDVGYVKCVRDEDGKVLVMDNESLAEVF